MLWDDNSLDLNDPDVVASSPQWAIKKAKDQQHALEIKDRCIPTPTEHDIDEYHLMKTFSIGYPDQSKSDRLCDALAGGGAFRRFKNLIYTLDVNEEWFRYKDEALKKIAIAWCEKHKLEWEPA